MFAWNWFWYRSRMAFICYPTREGDCFGNSIKCLASRASLQKLQDNQVLTPIYLWTGENSKSTHLKHIHCSEVEDTRINLQSQFDVMQPVQATCSYHTFIPITDTSLMMKKHSQTLCEQTMSISTQTIPGHSFLHNEWLCYCSLWQSLVVGICNGEIRGTWRDPYLILTFTWASSIFRIPVQLDELTLPVNCILSLPTPASETGRTYKLS
jgi:hypothetical protein